MQERTYDFSPSTGRPFAGGGFAVRTGAVQTPQWTPNASPLDPHEEPFSTPDGDGDDLNFGGDDYGATDAPDVDTIVDGDVGDIGASFEEYSNDEPPPPNIVV